MLEFDENGYDKNGFNNKGIHKDTGTRFDKNGYDCQGYDEFGLNQYGFTRDGHGFTINENGEKVIVFNKLTTRMSSKDNDNSYNKEINPRGFFGIGKNIFCYKENGELGDLLDTHDRRGFMLNGIDIETGTPYNKYGYDAYGYNKDGYDEYGFNKDGINEYTGTKLDLDGHNFCEARAYMRRKMKLPDGLDELGFNDEGLWNGAFIYSKETRTKQRRI